MENTKFSPKETGDRLKSKGIKPSVIRIKVLQYLLENRAHPNADAIHRSLSREMPTLSKTSIYNALKLFSEKGMVTEIKGENGELRYDGYTNRHAHFLCTECGKLFDIDLECQACKSKDLIGSKITEESVYLKGLCASCNKQG